MKKAILIVLGIVIVTVVVLANVPEPSTSYSTAEFPDTVNIAPLDEALTFARILDGDNRRLIAVTSYSDDSVTGYDLTALLGTDPEDPIALFDELGYEELKSRIESISEDASVYNIDHLTIPADFTDAHIAAGTNFAAHADESSVEEGPFLFAKMVTPTSFDAPVQVDSQALLDFEVELAYVTLSEMNLDEAPDYMGLVLSNDFTNRAKLLRALDPNDVISGKGFTTGKSAPGFLPVGNLFVIPRDYRAFSEPLELKLAWNDTLRQQAGMSLAIWDIDELFTNIKLRENVTWEYQGGQVGLPVDAGTVPARTLIMAGTPDGTIFQSPSTRTMVRGILKWVFGGWGESPVNNVIEYYITTNLANESFLSTGDVVRIHVDRVGEIRTIIERTE